MRQRYEVYKCEVCGNVITVLHGAKGGLVCCGEPMNLCQENITDAAREKHVPIVEKTDDDVVIKVGSVAHPMEESHYIEWVEIIADGKSYRCFLEPGDVPEAKFKIGTTQMMARAYCNLHGLWKG